MKIFRLSCFLVLPGVFWAPAFGQSRAQSRAQSRTPANLRSDFLAYGAPVAPAPADPAIAAAIAQISEARIHQTIETLVGFGTRNTLSSMDTDLGRGKGINAAADWIFGQFEALSTECGGCLEVKRDTFTNPVAPRIPKPTTLTNVYAILRGSGPSDSGAEGGKRMFLVTGHYDSRNTDVQDTHGAAPGANDDASGVAVSLECARVLSAARAKGLKLPATLVFVAVAGEEQGLNGSAHLAKLAKDEGWQLEGVLNNDIVGGNTTPGDALQRKNTVRVFSEGFAADLKEADLRRVRGLGLSEDSASRELARAMSDVARSYTPGFAPTLIARPDRYLRGGDHTSFNREGFAAVRLTEWREDFNHQHQTLRTENGVEYGDLLKFVDFRYVARVARLNAATLATLASAPGAPREVKFDMRGLDNGSTLTWKAPAGAAEGTNASGIHYELLWRETTAPDWQFVKEIPAAQGDLQTVSVPVSKDNVIFGLRAVDAKGHRGLVVTP